MTASVAQSSLPFFGPWVVRSAFVLAVFGWGMGFYGPPVFLHAVVEGGADRSYGVHVARLAGVPERVTRRAALLLRDLEARPSSASAETTVAPSRCGGACEELLGMDLLAITPLQAHAELLRLQQLAQRPPP